MRISSYCRAPPPTTGDFGPKLQNPAKGSATWHVAGGQAQRPHTERDSPMSISLTYDPAAYDVAEGTYLCRFEGVEKVDASKLASRFDNDDPRIEWRFKVLTGD